MSPEMMAWIAARGVVTDRLIIHLDCADLKPGDTVVGTLPVHLAAEVCARGARYLHLTLDLPPEARGRELTAEELDRYGARLCGYHVEPMSSPGGQDAPRCGQLSDTPNFPQGALQPIDSKELLPPS